MNIHIVTLFPEFFESPLSCGLLGKAIEEGLVKVHFHNPRAQTTDVHQSVDDRPYGGGPGMVMLLEPLLKTLTQISQATCETCGQGATPSQPPAETTGPMAQQSEAAAPNSQTLLLAAAGKPFSQNMARELASKDSLTLICGRYEGVDARLQELVPLTAVSIGPYVLNGGETAALNVIEAVCRLLPGFMGKEESGEEESYSSGFLEYPHYTRPKEYAGHSVPEVLLTGNHAKIEQWRRAQSLHATWKMQPELLKEKIFSESDIFFLKQIPRNTLGRNLFIALVHYPVLDKEKKTAAVSLTNLDIHDIARCSCSYGLGGAYIVTPLQDQQHLLQDILQHWLKGAGSTANPHRAAALREITHAASVEEAVLAITAKCGQQPYLLASSAKGSGNISYPELRKILAQQPVLLLLGTSHGLAPQILDRCHGTLPPLRFLDSYNHLSVRMAGAIMVDRILGDWA